jgi:hypothetical protein
MADVSPEDCDDEQSLVILRSEEAELILHVLAAFERLLRHAELSPAQMCLLLPDGAGPADRSSDLIMAEVTAEAGEPLRRQLA